MKEIWKDIKDYEGRYQINEAGQIKNIIKTVMRNGTTLIPNPYYNKLMRFGINTSGYFMTSLRKDGVSRTKTIHQLVAEAFIPNPENKPCINHKDGNKLNNHVDNLEWCTYSENMLHARRNNLIRPATKLRPEKAAEIRGMYQLGMFSQYKIATEFGISQALVSKIVSGKAYLNV